MQRQADNPVEDCSAGVGQRTQNWTVRWSHRLSLLHQLLHTHPERPGEPVEDRDGRIAGASLDATDVGPVQTALEGQLLL